MSELEKSPVKNGCSGNCCECFTLPFTMYQLIEMQKRDNLSQKDKDDLPKVLEMLIYLGKSEIDPQTGNSFNDNFKAIGWTDDQIVQEDIKRHVVENGIIKSHIYTCKYFDTEKRICNNYENRPNMCKRFGPSCQYEGCCYSDKYYNDMKVPLKPNELEELNKLTEKKDK